MTPGGALLGTRPGHYASGSGFNRVGQERFKFPESAPTKKNLSLNNDRGPRRHRFKIYGKTIEFWTVTLFCDTGYALAWAQNEA